MFLKRKNPPLSSATLKGLEDHESGGKLQWKMAEVFFLG